MNKKDEISTQEAIEIASRFEIGEEWDTLSPITDQGQARAFLEWACGPEGDALRQRLREANEQ